MGASRGENIHHVHQVADVPPPPPPPEDEEDNSGIRRGVTRRPRRREEEHKLEQRSLNWTKFAPYRNAVLSAGGYHSAAIDEDGRLYTWGAGEYGQLGHGEGFNDQWTPMAVLPPWPSKIQAMQVSCGVYHTAVVTTDGLLWTCGYEGSGLGHGDFQPADKMENVWVPKWVRMPALSIRVRQVSAGWNHTTFCTWDKGHVYAFGRGGEGRLGQGNVLDYPTPTSVSHLRDVPIVAVGAGKEHSGAVAADGRLFMWGMGKATGLGSEDTQLLPRHVQTLTTFYKEHVVAVECGASHTVAMAESGAVYTWGWGGVGQLGHGYKADELLPKPINLGGMKAIAISTSAYHTVLATADGQMVTFGAGGKQVVLDDETGETMVTGEMGRLGYSGVDDEIGGDRTDPKVVHGPWRLQPRCAPAHVAAGGYHSLMATEGGGLLACGVALNGRLGSGDDRDRYSPHVISAFNEKRRITPRVKEERPHSFLLALGPAGKSK